LKNVISVFFSFIFLLIIAAPTLLLVAEDSLDVSFIIDIGEEENTEKESKNNLEIDVFKTNELVETYLDSENTIFSEYYFRSYGKLYKKLHSPPPEQV